MPTQKNEELKLNIISVPPALSVDGNGIKIFDDKYAEIVFFQTIDKNDNIINARGVSNLRMSLEQLKSFQQTIDKVIKDTTNQKK